MHSQFIESIELKLYNDLNINYIIDMIRISLGVRLSVSFNYTSECIIRFLLPFDVLSEIHISVLSDTYVVYFSENTLIKYSNISSRVLNYLLSDKNVLVLKQLDNACCI